MPSSCFKKTVYLFTIEESRGILDQSWLLNLGNHVLINVSPLTAILNIWDRFTISLVMLFGDAPSRTLMDL